MKFRREEYADILENVYLLTCIAYRWMTSLLQIKHKKRKRGKKTQKTFKENKSISTAQNEKKGKKEKQIKIMITGGKSRKTAKTK